MGTLFFGSFLLALVSLLLGDVMLVWHLTEDDPTNEFATWAATSVVGVGVGALMMLYVGIVMILRQLER